MDERRQRIFEDLTGVIDGELRCDPLTISMYSTDASLHQIAPLAVAFPRSRDDVVALAKYAAEQHIPITARGSGTGVAGGALGGGLVVDFSRHMNRVISVDEDTVRVEPGIVRDRLNAVLAQSGRYFPPDPSNSSITTVGGMMAVDAAGSHSVRSRVNARSRAKHRTCARRRRDVRGRRRIARHAQVDCAAAR